MEDGTGRGHDQDRAASCNECGWSGSGAPMGAAGPGDDPDDHAVAVCPRCGSPVSTGLPSVEEILAARRAPAPEA